MKGWLITNKYYVSSNLLVLKDILIESSKRFDIDLTCYNNIEILNVLSDSNYKKPDFVLFWDKDVKLASYLESENIRVFNRSDSIKNCDDKSLTYLKLRNKNIKMPKTIFSPLMYYHDIYKDEEYIDYILNNLSFPFVYKECYGSFGKQVYLINDKNELIDRIKKSDTWPFEMQELVKSSFGKDIRVYVVGNEIVGGMKRINKNGDFRANLEIGGVSEKCNLNDRQAKMALTVVSELKLDFAGVDILFGENEEPVLCEVNSNAFFIGFNKTLNLNVADYIFKHILKTLS